MWYKQGLNFSQNLASWKHTFPFMIIKMYIQIRQDVQIGFVSVLTEAGKSNVDSTEDSTEQQLGMT